MDDEKNLNGTTGETEFSRQVAARRLASVKPGGTPRRASGSASE